MPQAEGRSYGQPIQRQETLVRLRPGGRGLVVGFGHGRADRGRLHRLRPAGRGRGQTRTGILGIFQERLAGGWLGRRGAVCHTKSGESGQVGASLQSKSQGTGLKPKKTKSKVKALAHNGPDAGTEKKNPPPPPYPPQQKHRAPPSAQRLDTTSTAPLTRPTQARQLSISPPASAYIMRHGPCSSTIGGTSSCHSGSLRWIIWRTSALVWKMWSSSALRIG